ncbi:MAG: hypothetical protein J6W27_03540 [Alphaproteobacteria bacterium]|nr:hypothetical protein [Alphaproteobacteria bacterium]
MEKTKNINMNFVKPPFMGNAKRYRMHCHFKLEGPNHVLNVYDCNNIKDLNSKDVEIRVSFSIGDDVFVFQPEDNKNHLFDMKLFKQNCKNCQHRNYAGRGSR